MNKKFFFLFLLLVLMGFSLWFVIKRLESQGPLITLAEKVTFLNRKQEIKLRVEDPKSGLRTIMVLIEQGNDHREIYSQDVSGSLLWGRGHERSKEIVLSLDPNEMKLKEGPLSLIVKARDYSWRNVFQGNMTTFQESITVDMTPPLLSCLSTQHYLNQGGTGLVVYQVSKDAVKSGVKIGEQFFPGFLIENNAPDPVYLVYFAMPYDQRQSTIQLAAQDEAGNESRGGFPYLIRAKNFRKDSLTISDHFLQTKIPQLFSLDQTLSTLSPVEAFLKINNSQRQKDNQKIREICQRSVAEMLWEGEFLRMQNAKPSALFADERTYLYNGREIDKQTHLGVDLASLAHAPIEAANHGLVVYAGELGIYGRTIVLDHGQNLFSMYSHLSAYKASLGQKVRKGETIGTSGDTGLAGGDHLHFSILIGGAFINPIEWWDKHWIEDNILLKIQNYIK